jgi:serine/threonine-protein kinase
MVGALAAVVALAVAVGLLQMGSGTPSDAAPRTGTTAEETTTAPATPSTVALAAAGLMGRPVAEVQAELVGRGLQVQLAPVETGDVAAGQVTAVGPEGALAPGTVVTVSYAVPPVVIPAPADNGNGNGKGNGNNGNWNGNGNGNGRGGDDEDD